LENLDDRPVLAGETPVDAGLERGKPLGEFLVGGERFAQADERAHDLDVDGDRARGAKDRAKHGHPLFGEDPGRITASAAAFL
jgi:hypothetical protein